MRLHQGMPVLIDYQYGYLCCFFTNRVLEDNGKKWEAGYKTTNITSSKCSDKKWTIGKEGYQQQSDFDSNNDRKSIKMVKQDDNNKSYDSNFIAD